MISAGQIAKQLKAQSTGKTPVPKSHVSSTICLLLHDTLADGKPKIRTFDRGLFSLCNRNELRDFRGTRLIIGKLVIREWSQIRAFRGKDSKTDLAVLK